MSKSDLQILSKDNIAAAEKHLSKCDKIMRTLILKHGTCNSLLMREYQPFQTLVRSIISQQLSTKAADTIESRIAEVVPRPFRPDKFLNLSMETLRSKGLSQAKARYIVELSKSIVEEKINFNDLIQKSDEQVIEALLKLHGIGRWTADIFLIFGLKRPDVLAVGDAGLQRAAELLYPSADGKNKVELLKEVSEAWRPYRSVASWYLWRSLDEDVIKTGGNE